MTGCHNCYFFLTIKKSMAKKLKLSEHILGIVGVYFEKDADEVTAKDIQKFEKDFPGTLNNLKNGEADRSRLYRLPENLPAPKHNRGAGDCLYLCLIQLLEPAMAAPSDIEQVVSAFRQVTAEGLETVMEDTGVSWTDFKTLLNENDQRFIENMSEKFNTVFEADELQHMTPRERDAIEMDWFKAEIRSNSNIWGDNMYLLMFLRSPRNPYTRDVRINFIILDRLAPALQNRQRTQFAAPICIGSTPTKRNQKCFWGMLVRTRTDKGRGGLHYEAVFFDRILSNQTRYKGMYSTRIFATILRDINYMQFLEENTECHDKMRECLEPYQRPRR